MPRTGSWFAAVAAALLASSAAAESVVPAWEQLKAQGAALGVPAPPLERAQSYAREVPPPGSDAELFEKTYRAVVAIERWTGGRRTGQGSGFLIDPEGHLLTNHHVIEQSRRGPPVTLIVVRYGPSGRGDGRLAEVARHAVRVIGDDPRRDLALLKIEGPRFPFLDLQTRVRVGEPVWAIGAAHGFAETFSKGIVSGVGRHLDELVVGVIQTTAELNPGNSGGPLLNAYGQVVGINEAIYDGANGIGFALPIGKLVRPIEQLRKTGIATVGRIGIGIAEPADPSRGGPPIVESVRLGGPAGRAGLKPGDAIMKVGGQPVADVPSVLEAIVEAVPGQTLTVEVRRQGQTLTILTAVEADLRVSGPPDSLALPPPGSPPPSPPRRR